MCHKMSDRGHGDLDHGSGENILSYWVDWCYCSSETPFFCLTMQLTRSQFFSYLTYDCIGTIFCLFFRSSHLWCGSERAELVKCHSADNLLFHFTLNLVLFALLNILWCSWSLFKRRFAALFICMWLICAQFCKTQLISKSASRAGPWYKVGPWYCSCSSQDTGLQSSFVSHSVRLTVMY